jgi:hypothetical protein
MLLTNCTNCGAPLKFKEQDYGKLAKCSYCDTEYHLDLLGRVEEYKVKLKIMGEVKEFYISQLEVDPFSFDNTYMDSRYISPDSCRFIKVYLPIICFFAII